MRRLSILASATATALLLIATTAPAASPERGMIVNVELRLKTSNGLHAQLETLDDGTVRLELQRKYHLVRYEVKGKVTRKGLSARFGRLGLIDVAFAPARTLSSTEPSEGCTGEPRTLREGTFTGTIDFTGERSYVRIKASRAKGSMSVISQWQCPEEPDSSARLARHLASSSRSEVKTATLLAFGYRSKCYFAAGINKKARSIFSAGKGERREGMKIFREIVAHAGASAFLVDLDAGTATVRPPRPFHGRATFELGPDDRPLWRSTLRMPFLGAASVNPRGPDFSVDLEPGFDFFD